MGEFTRCSRGLRLRKMGTGLDLELREASTRDVVKIREPCLHEGSYADYGASIHVGKSQTSSKM